MSTQTALITGATSGIGEATAQLFAQNNINLILCGRREERLEKLAFHLGKWVNVKILCFDLLDKKTIFKSIETLKSEIKTIDILVNNAGNAHGLDNFYEADLEDWDNMMDINVKGLLYVTKAVLPFMLNAINPHIINLGSIAGHEVYAKGNVYCASKFAVKAINDSMRIDLNQYNIKVSSVSPGLVETEFSLVRFKGDEEQAKNVYKDMKPLKSIDVARVILFMVQSPAHVNLADVILLPKQQSSSTLVNRSGN